MVLDRDPPFDVAAAAPSGGAQEAGASFRQAMKPALLNSAKGFPEPLKISSCNLERRPAPTV